MKPWWKARRITVFVVASALTFIAAIGISLLGIELVGGVEEWRGWLAQHTNAFRLWRMCLYSALAFAWYRLRRRQPLPPLQHRRLLGVEINIIGIIVVLEFMTFPLKA